jgi:hypothetical protein
MRRMPIMPGLLLALLLPALLPLALAAGAPHTGGGSCTERLAGWEKMADTSTVIPSFMFGGQLDIDRLLVCEDGVLFFFRTREWQRVIRFCLVYPKPTQEEYAKFYGQDEPDIQKRVQKVLTLTAEAQREFDDYKAQLREVLGRKYVEGKEVSFENQRFRAKLELSMGEPIVFSWRHRSASFMKLLDLYYMRPSDVPSWVTFVLLYPGPSCGL